MPANDRPIRVLFAGTTFVVGGAERILFHLVRGLAELPLISADGISSGSSQEAHHSRSAQHPDNDRDLLRDGERDEVSPRFEVELLALRDLGLVGEEIRTFGIPVHSGLTGSGKFDPGLVLRIRALLRSGRYDVIYFLDHAHAVFYGVIASVGTSVRVRVMPVHTTGQWNGQPSIKLPIRLVRSSLDRIIAIAEAQRRYLHTEEGVPDSQLVVIPNGIPIESPGIAEAQWRRAQMRELLGVEESTPVIGITAVLRPEKNHELAIEALALLREQEALKSAELWIVGDGVRRPELEAHAKRLHVEAAVRFLGHRSDARRLMAGFDVAILCSHPRVETLPLSLLEAMDAGVPVVATRVGALSEMVEQGVSGFLVEAGDAAAFASALSRVLCDRGEARRMGLRGQEIARERYSVSGMVERTAALLEQLLRGKLR